MMDFHSLSRRELQALCKRNKIPANMTNVAMADALKALETVDGFEEIMNHFQSNPAPSPMSTARTATRTARRKTIEAKTDGEFVINEPETPAAQSTRRRGPTASTKKNASDIYGSVQQAYSTRRSVRLLEKSMGDLTLKGKTTTEPVKIVESVTEANEEVKDPSGAEESEIFSGRNLSSTLEKEWDMRDKQPEDDNSDVMVASDKSLIIEDVSGIEAKAESKEETIDKFGTCLTKDPEDASDGKGSDGIPVSENSPEFVKEEVKNVEAPDFSESMTSNNSLVALPATAEPANSPKKIAIMVEEETNDDTLDNTATEVNTEEESESDSDSEQSGVYSDQEVELAENEFAESDQNDSDQSVDDLCDADFQGNSDTEKLAFNQLEEQGEDQSSAESNEFDDDLSETESEIKTTSTKEQQENETLDDTNMLAELEDQDPTSDRTPDSPLVTAASGGKGRTPLSPFTAESISSQFPRPNLLTPGKEVKSVQKLTIADDKNEENFDYCGIENKTEEAEKKDNAVDEEVLKGVSLRQLTKRVKELQIKKRPALQKLPGNQIVEEN